MELKPLRPEIDVSRLPTESFGHHDLTWWGTLGFMVIEGATLAVCVSAYFYLRQNFDVWPPLRTPRPDLLVPTINVGLMLLSLVPAWLTERAAKSLNKRGSLIGLLALSAFMVTFVVLRWFEFWALNTRWDSNAYGSIAWIVLGTHATLLAVEAGVVIGLAAALFRPRLPARVAGDVADVAFYWYFIVLVWVPTYAIVFLLPWVRR
jgi:heme/copper-type cytochrome/quinol oxidase subunit 3